MQKNIRLYYGLAVVSLILITSCASSTLVSTWKDESFSGNIKGIFIIGIAEEPGIRRMFEREFANQLSAHGITALPSNQVIPTDQVLDKETIVSAIKDKDIDAVLITRLVDRRSVRTHSTDWYNQYTRSYGRTFLDEIVNLETNLYDVDTEQLIWSSLSETVMMEEDSTFNNIRSFISLVVRRLKRDGLI